MPWSNFELKCGFSSSEHTHSIPKMASSLTFLLHSTVHLFHDRVAGRQCLALLRNVCFFSRAPPCQDGLQNSSVVLHFNLFLPKPCTHNSFALQRRVNHLALLFGFDYLQDSRNALVFMQGLITTDCETPMKLRQTQKSLCVRKKVSSAKENRTQNGTASRSFFCLFLPSV